MEERTFDRITKLISSYLSTKAVFLLDLFVSFLASLLTVLMMNFITTSGLYNGFLLWIWLGASIIWSGVLFLFSGSYRLVIRHSGMREIFIFALVSFGKGVLLTLTLIFALLISDMPVPTSLWVLALAEMFVTFTAFVFMRVLMVAVYDHYNKKLKENQNCQSVLVYGLSDKSISAVTRLQKSPHYKVLGFVSSTQEQKNLKMVEYPVYYVQDLKDLLDLKDRLSIGAVLFTREADVRDEKERLINFASSCGVKTLFAPGIDEVVAGSLLQSHIREVGVEDLLGRDEIKISLDEIKAYFKEKVVMVTGAAGSIGSELCRQLAGFGVKRLILFDNGETAMHNLRLELEEKYPWLTFVPIIGDVRAEPRLDFAFRKWKPQVVFHAAAYKHVPLMEENPCEAVLVNVIGTRQVADKCLQYGAEKMVMISTDKAVNPTNVMGCSKRLAEIYVQSLSQAIERGEVKGKTKFVTTRFGNVLGSNGSVIPRFRAQIAKGGPVTVTHPDITRFFMTIPEACRLVMEAATKSEGNNIFVFDMGESVKIDHLARKMIELAGFVPDLDIKVEYTGLRPGEKLYEEVLSNKENTTPSFHERIRVAQVRQYDYEDARVAVDRLEELSRAVEIPTMVKYMKDIVPEYISNNSRFEEYDKK